MKKPKQNPAKWGDATKLVRGGLERTGFGETSEALYLNSGFVYDAPETAEARFAHAADRAMPVILENKDLQKLWLLDGGMDILRNFNCALDAKQLPDKIETVYPD